MTQAEIIRDSRSKGLTMLQIIDRLMEAGHLSNFDPSHRGIVKLNGQIRSEGSQVFA